MTRNWNSLLLLVGGSIAIYAALGALLVIRDRVESRNLNTVSSQWLDRLLTPLAPRLPLEQLSCGGQPLTHPIVLNAAGSSCSVTIDAQPAAAFWRTEIVISGSSVVRPLLFIRARPPAPSGLPRDCVPIDAHAPMPAVWLAVEYEDANGATTEDAGCWQPMGTPGRLELTLLTPAAIDLTCHGCDSTRTHLALSFR